MFRSLRVAARRSAESSRSAARRRRVVAAGLAGLAGVLLLAAVLALFGGPGAVAAKCDRRATPSSFASKVRAAKTGQTLCLASGNYGTWTGTNKAITVTAASGASATLRPDFGSGTQDFTIDGTLGGGRLTIPGGAIRGNLTYAFQPDAPHNITIQHSSFTTTALTIDYIVDNGAWPFTVMLNHDTFNNINYDGGRIRLPYNQQEVDSGVIVQNSILANGAADGINSGAGITILHNEFSNIKEGAFPHFHSDSIQVFGRGAAHTIIRANWIHNGADGIAAYDGLSNALIEDNAISSDVHQRCLEIYADNTGPAAHPSLIEHNTLYRAGDGSGCTIDLDTKPGTYPPGTGTTVQGNVVPGGIGLNHGSTAAVNVGNMCESWCGAGNLVGSATFVGGANPTSYAGFRLSFRSRGASADGGVGVGLRYGAGARARQ